MSSSSTSLTRSAIGRSVASTSGHPIPNQKTLQRNVKKVEAITLERINVFLVEHAIAAEIDDGNKARVDCTVMETNIHEPTDSSLLVDSVRVLAS